MSMRPFAWLTAIVLAAATAAPAQVPGPPTVPGGDHFWEFQPFLDPGYFNPDFQFFAPAVVDDFGGEEKPNTGLYVTFVRTYVNVSRPIDTFSFGSGNQGDFTWGNRMEVGYMKGDPAGWQAVLWHVNGPNERFVNSEFLEEIQNISTTPVTQQILSPGAIDTVNQLKMSSFELNRVWRRPQFHNGTNFEPFVGYRYMNVKDYWQRQTLIRELVGSPPQAGTSDEFFDLLTNRSVFENQMHGGQLGARFSRQRGHWMLSADLRFFAMANFQTLQRLRERSVLPNPEEILVDGTAVDLINPLGTGADLNRTVAYDRATQFCFGGEVRGEASYELTRDINLRVGFVFLDMGQGIGRGNLMRLNNQAVQMAGVTFGFTVNR
jgi:hypothetical protein